MRIGFLILLFLTASYRLSAYSRIPQNEEAIRSLKFLSANNLCFSTTQTPDSLMALGRQVENVARKAGDIGMEFKAGQVQVNTYALEGRLALAANKAQELLDRAYLKESPLATGLALQALGNTYMHTDRFQRADSLYIMAATYIFRHGTPYQCIELLLQHLYVNLKLRKTEQAGSDIERIHGLLIRESGPEAETYKFLTNCFEAFRAIELKEIDTAQALIDGLVKRTAKKEFDIWLHILQGQYDLLVKKYDEALPHYDSALNITAQTGGGNNLRELLMAKALMLEKIDRADEASTIYKQIHSVTDSLYELHYTSQIDSLRVTYWVDLLHTATITKRNKLYTRFIIALAVLALGTIVVISFIRRKNRELMRSRLELEAARKASDDTIRTRSLFLSNMSHELRTPLNAITGFSSILTEEADLDQQTREQCNNYIRQNADLLLKLINDVVDLSELRSETMHFTYAPCDLIPLCRNVLSTIDNVKRTEAQLSFEADMETLVIDTDKERLQQILINLLINATKFTTKGHITLRLEIDNVRNEAVFTVEDTGCGIPLEKQGQIFERFEKLHEKAQGAGLGLSICKLIVDHTGGRIWIDPSYTQGARFVFTHPLTTKNPTT